MSAALRRAFELYEADDPSAGDRLRQVSIPDREHRPILHRLYDYFGRARGDGHPFVEAAAVVHRAGEAGEDPDAAPLFEAIAALPEGQAATLFEMLDLTCAFAVCEGIALGAAYVTADSSGREARFRSRPRR